MKQPFLLRINASKAAVFILWMIMERLTASAFAAELGSKEVLNLSAQPMRPS